MWWRAKPDRHDLVDCRPPGMTWARTEPDVPDAAKIRQALIALILCAWASPGAAVEATLEVENFPEDGVEYLRGASVVLQTADNPEATSQDLVAAARADYARMISALYELGHYGGVVNVLVDGREAANISPISVPGVVQRITVKVDPGPVFLLSTAYVGPLAPGTELPEEFAVGQRAFSSGIGDAATAGVDGWRDVGHAKANIARQSVTADHRNSTLAADIRLDPGPRLSFGALNITKEGKVKPRRIREIAGLPSGEVFSPEEVEDAAVRLRRTGAFRSVVLSEADTIGPGNTLDINATLVDSKPRRVGVGIELFSLEGLALSGFWMHRNLLGGAERLRIDAEISGIGGNSGGEDYRLAARFDRPATFTPDTALFLEASIEEQNDPDFRERTARVGSGLSHIFSDTLTGEVGVAYQYSDIDDAFGSRQLEHLLLPARLTYDTRDDTLNATRGLYLDLDATPFAGLGNSGSGGRLYLDARTYRSFGPEDDLVFAARAQLGSVIGPGLNKVPPDMLFFSGGAGTVRGQPYQSLAVELPGNLRVGGRSFVGLSGELRKSLFGPWAVVGFADTGFVGKDSWGTGNGDWHSGGGFGVRYDTGFGPIRVDVATPIGDDAGKDFELYIGIGQAF